MIRSVKLTQTWTSHTWRSLPASSRAVSLALTSEPALPCPQGLHSGRTCRTLVFTCRFSSMTHTKHAIPDFAWFSLPPEISFDACHTGFAWHHFTMKRLFLSIQQEISYHPTLACASTLSRCQARQTRECARSYFLPGSHRPY